MKKLLLFMAMSVMTTVALAGCGKASSTDAGSGETLGIVEESIEMEVSEEENTVEYDESKYVGMTIKEFVADNNEMSGYMGMNGSYVFEAISEEKKAKYQLRLSDDAGEIIENKDFFDDYKELIQDCTIVEIEARYVDDNDLQKYVGKTIKDVEADGISISGSMYGKSNFSIDLTLIGMDGDIAVYIEFSEEDNKILETLEDIETEILIDAYADCSIEKIYYVLY